MWLKRIGLQNWMVYKGTVELELEPKAYSLVAKSKADPARSNFLGKSAIPEAVYFALTGRLNKDRHSSASGWITDGEKRGYVELEFDDGSVVRRSYVKSTQLELHYGFWDKAKGDEAQALIYQALGQSADDMLVTSYFQQRQMARIVLDSPGDRMGYVSAWLQLAPLEKGEELLREEVTKLAWAADNYNQRLAQSRALEVHELGSATLDDLVRAATETATAALKAKGTHARLSVVHGENRMLQHNATVIAEYEALSDEYLELVDSINKHKPSGEELQLAHQDALRQIELQRDIFRAATRDVELKRKLSVAQFDGHCPVANFDCPAAVEINSRVKENKKAYSSASEIAAVHGSRLQVAEQNEHKARIDLQAFGRLVERRANLRDRLERAQNGYEEAKAAPPAADAEDLSQRVLSAANRLAELTSKLDALNKSIETVQKARVEQEKVQKDLELVEAKLALHREAATIFGKQGAQRRVAESALVQIQDGANAMLDECGINLSVEVSWAREGSGLAKACDRCGHPFPTSAKAKHCERCRAERGAHLINKLDILISEQSGAAEDLVGCALQLSASAWLRANRGSCWSTAMLDEPTSQLDKAHRQAFMSHLTSMLSSRYGFEQSIVISHHSEIVDALPGRIEITHDGRYSTARVVA